MAHPAKTLMADRVVFYRKDDPRPHVAFVTMARSDHLADLVYYCPVSHQWSEAGSVPFGKKDGGYYFVNPEDV